jgi:hypothetical protein
MTNWRQETTLQLLREVAVFIQEWEDDKMTPADYEAKNHLSNLVGRVITVAAEREGTDYRKLLKKYIDHVGNMEGIDFLDNQWHPATNVYTPPFTKEEWEELIEISRHEEQE